MLAALADPVRLRILAMLRERERCVCHLTSALQLAQPTISHHMAILKRAGLVRDRHDARWTYYRLEPSAARALSESIATLLDTTHTDPGPAAGCAPASCSHQP